MRVSTSELRGAVALVDVHPAVESQGGVYRGGRNLEAACPCVARPGVGSLRAALPGRGWHGAAHPGMGSLGVAETGAAHRRAAESRVVWRMYAAEPVAKVAAEVAVRAARAAVGEVGGGAPPPALNRAAAAAVAMPLAPVLS